MASGFQRGLVILIKSSKILFLSALLLGLPVWVSAGSYIGDRACYSCHKDIKKAYLGDMHGRVFTKNPGSILEERGCEACHGPGSAHKEAADLFDKGQNIPTDIDFPFRKGPDYADENNRRCLACHEKGVNMHWRGSQHEMEGVGCVNCHSIHSEEAVDGTRVCVRCHVQKRAQLQRSSHIPIREGNVKCSSCHNPHGSMGPHLLKEASVNENCYSCHAEKRGPLIWEHAPVRENCSNCHDAHGSNFQSLLKIKVPYLCESCHSMSWHPGELYDGSKTVAGGSPDKHLLGKGCLNCHPLIHGSNHPSGARFNR